jgi:hypothetical protein
MSKDTEAVEDVIEAEFNQRYFEIRCCDHAF